MYFYLKLWFCLFSSNRHVKYMTYLDHLIVTDPYNFRYFLYFSLDNQDGLVDTIQGFFFLLNNACQARLGPFTSSCFACEI